MAQRHAGVGSDPERTRRLLKQGIETEEILIEYPGGVLVYVVKKGARRRKNGRPYTDDILSMSARFNRDKP